MKLTPELIAEYAQEVESGDPIDFGMLAVDEAALYKMVSCSMIEHYDSLEPQDRDLMLLSVATKLVVENFVLNLKLNQKPL